MQDVTFEIVVTCWECDSKLNTDFDMSSGGKPAKMTVKPCETCMEAKYAEGREAMTS